MEIEQCPLQCTFCGAPLPQWPPFGPLISVCDDDADNLLQLYRGDFDELKCEGCERSLSLTPSLVVSFDEYTLEYVYYGSLARQYPDTIREIEEDAKAKGTTLHSDFESPDKLRDAAWQILAARVAAFYRALNVVLTAVGEAAWETAWPAVTSSACAATFVSRLVHLPVPLETKLYNSVASYSHERISRGFQEVQARTWVSMCERRLLSHPPNTSLEQDFQQYLATSAVIGGAPELFFEHITSLDLKNLNAGVRYAYYAAEATLHWLLRTPNPNADAWASSYLALETARADCPPEQAATLATLSVSEQRSRDTIERQSLARAISQAMAGDLIDENTYNVVQMDETMYNAVQTAVSKAGHPDLVGQGYTQTKLVRKDGSELPIDELAAMMQHGLQQWSNQPKELEVWFNLMRQSLLQVSADELVAIIQELENPYLNNPIVLTIVRNCLGHILCMRREPEPFLAHISEDPEPWESSAPLDLRCVLWLWRSRALRLVARPRRALELLSALIDTDRDAFTKLKPHIQQNVYGDLALSYVDLGQLETALAIQTAILNDPKAKRTPWHLRAAASTYERLGRYSDAIPLWREALAGAVQSEAELRPTLQANLANALVHIGEANEARQLLDQISDEALSNPETFIVYSVAILNLGIDSLPEDKQNRLFAIGKRVAEVALDGLKKNDTLLYLTATRFIAALVGTSGNLEVWEMLESHSREFEKSPDPQALLVLAQRDWVRGEPDAAVQRLLEFSESIAARFADTRDVSVSLHALEQFRSKLNAFGDLVGSAEAPSANARLIGEIQRDLLGRIAARSTMENLTSFIAPDDEIVAEISTGGRPVGVLEWISGTRDVYWLFSWMTQEGHVVSSWLEPPPVDIISLSKKVNHCLSVWTVDRTGDPFDLSDWKLLENWLANELEDRLPKGGILVVLEHAKIAGLQWHVAAAPRWRVSYVPSWTALLKARRAEAAVKKGSIGLVMVPKHHDSSANLQALESSVSRTMELAADLGNELKSVLREACDRDALIRVFESTSIAKVLCHGFVDPDEDVVALMVACDGVLPVADNVAANTSVGRRHRFDWRDCQHLKSAPAVLFSAACKSGRSHQAGLGEKLGLFSTLRRVGTKSFIAPRWDIIPAKILPILDDVIERYLKNGDELGEALHMACIEANRIYPKWLAWSLALEGDWK